MTAKTAKAISVTSAPRCNRYGQRLPNGDGRSVCEMEIADKRGRSSELHNTDVWERFDYAAIGTVSNVASRLCDEASPGKF
jgi:hypothetical protein